MTDRLPRADSVGEKDVFRSKSGNGADADSGLTGLLTINRHHLARGAAWRLDTAGAPRPYVPVPQKPLKKGEAARCLCGFSAGYGPDMAIAQQRAMQKCFNCRLRRFAALDPRGAQDAGAMQDAIARVYREDIKSRFKIGGCSCDLPVGRLLNPTTMRPFGWFQGHTGVSKSKGDEWQGGKYRAEAIAAKKQKQPWWERSEAGTRYTESLGDVGEKAIRSHLQSSDASKSKLGGFKYSPCKSYVYPPSEYLGEDLSADTDLPEADLELEFIYGYSAGWITGLPSTEMGIKMGSDAQDNLFWVATGEIVYFAAATGILYDPVRHRQRYFHGHDDRITSLAVSPNRRLVATGQCGQYPKVCVWSAVDGSRDIKPIRCFESVPPSRVCERKVASVTFLTDTQLVAMGADDKYTVHVWELAKGELLARFQAGLSSPVYLIRSVYGWTTDGDLSECSKWGPLSLSGILLVSQGAKHLSFWMLQEEWSSSTVFTDTNPLCVAFALSTGEMNTDMFVGEQSGAISTWRAGKVVHEVKNAHVGGVTQLMWTSYGLLSGGMDCILKVWIRDGIYLRSQPDKVLDLKRFSNVSHSWATRCIIPKGLDVRYDGKIILGLASSQILLIDSPDTWDHGSEPRKMVTEPLWALSKGSSRAFEDPPRKHGKVLLEAHYCRSDSDILQGISTFPHRAFNSKAEATVPTNGEKMSHLIVTCGPDESFRVWDLVKRRQIEVIGTEFLQRNGITVPVVPNVIDISPNGMMAVLGFLGGQWALYFKVGLEGNAWTQIFITDSTERRACESRIKSLEHNLDKTLQDPYRAQHTLEIPTLRSKIAEEKGRLEKIIDYAMSEDVTVVKFAPNGFWIAVGSHDGFIKIFSIKEFQVRSTGDVWLPIWEPGLSSNFLPSASDWKSLNDESPAFSLDVRALIEERNRKFARGVVAGEIPMDGLKGEVKQVGICKGHMGAILRCDWSMDCLLLRSSSSGFELLYWETPKGAHSNKAHEHRDKVWASNTVIFGWYLQGVFCAASTGSSVQAVDVSRVAGTIQTVVTADTEGHVKLFRYPCSGYKSRYKAYIGHTSSIRNITFAEDDSRVLSLGGNDCCIFQWKYIPKFPEILRTPSNDQDLSVLSQIYSREIQIKNRRAAILQNPFSVSVIFDEEFQIQEGVPNCRLLLSEEIAQCFGLKTAEDVVRVPRISTSGASFVAEVLIFNSTQGADFGQSLHSFALRLIDRINDGELQAGNGKIQILRHAKAARLNSPKDVMDTVSRAGVALDHRMTSTMIPDRRVLSAEQDPQMGGESPKIAEDRNKSPKRDNRGMLINKTEKSQYPWHLELDFVFGFQEFDKIGNLCLLTNGRLAYTAGALAVLHSSELGEQKFFKGHSQDISCLALSPDGVLMCSADTAQQPTLLVWDSENFIVAASIQATTEGVSRDALGITVLCRTIEAVSPFLMRSQSSFERTRVIVRDAIGDGQIAVGRYIRIDNELLLVEEMVGDALECRRACYDTSAERHSQGTMVYCVSQVFVPYQPGGVAAVAFTTVDFGERIVSVGAANDHTLVLHDWRKGRVIAHTITGQNKILALYTHPTEDTIVTCGINHLRFWKVNGAKLEEFRPVFGSLGRNQTFLCAAFCFVQYQMFNQERWEEGCPGGIVTLTGTADGFIYMWEEHYLAKVIRYAHDSPIFSLFVESLSCDLVVSGGRDGKLKLWNLTDFTEPPRSMIATEHLVLEINMEDTYMYGGGQDMSIRGICMEQGIIYVGTSANKIFRVAYQLSPPPEYACRDNLDFETAGESKIDLIVPGHHDRIIALAGDLSRAACATATADGYVIAWDVGSRTSTKSMKLFQRSAHCLCFASHGELLVAGLSDGAVLFLSTQELLPLGEQSSGLSRGCIQAISFSPDPGSFVACASEDGQIFILDWKAGEIAHIGTARGTPTRSPSLDWSSDCSFLATNMLNEVATLHSTSGNVEICTYDSCDASKLSSWTSLHGSASCGILSEDGSSAGFCCVQRHPTSAIMACGDDLGRISLFDYPCSKEAFASASYASHVGCVRQVGWCSNGQLLISAGDEDRMLIVWRLVPSVEEALDSHKDEDLLRIVKRCCNPEAHYSLNIQESDCNDIPRTPQFVAGLVEPFGWHGNADQGLPSLPDESFKLNHVVGINGRRLHNTMAILTSGDLVFAISGMCVVQSLENKKQKFFTLHRKEICCLAAHPTEDVVATGEAGMNPCIHVWRTSAIQDGRETLSLQIQGGLREGVSAICFCGHGAKLACVEKNEHSTLHLYEWMSGRKLTMVKLDENRGPSILAIRCDSYGNDQIATVGVRHVKFWSLLEKKMAGKPGIIGPSVAPLGRMQIFTCVDFVRKAGVEDVRCAITGAEDGSIYVWAREELVGVVPAAHQGPVFALCATRTFPYYFWSAGADSQIVRWRSVCAADNSAIREPGIQGKGSARVVANVLFERAGTSELKNREGRAVGGIGCICAAPEGETVVTATTSGSVFLWRIDIYSSAARELHDISAGSQDDNWMPPTGGSPQEVIQSHEFGPIPTACVEPLPGRTMLVTGGPDKYVHIWDMSQPRRLDSVGLPAAVTAMDWGLSLNPALVTAEQRSEQTSGDIAVGLEDGQVFTLHKADSTRFQMTNILSNSLISNPNLAVRSLRYTAEGDFLAVGRHNGRIELLQVVAAVPKPNYTVYTKLKGHSSPVRALDWSLSHADGRRYLRSNAFAPVPECLHWELTPAASNPPAAEVTESRDSMSFVDETPGKLLAQLVRNPRTLASAQWREETCRFSWGMRGLIQELMMAGRGLAGTSMSGSNRQGAQDWVGGIAAEFRPQGPVTVARSFNGRLLACGDAIGGLYVFRYPCLGPGSLGHNLRGHISPIASVVFSTDGRFIVSTEEAHGCFFMWRQAERTAWAQTDGMVDDDRDSATQQGSVRLGAMIEQEEEALAEGDEMAAKMRFTLQRCVRIGSAGSGWREVLLSLHAAREAYGRTTVREERWSKLSTDAESLRRSCLDALRQACADAIGLTRLGRVDESGLPAATLILAARECLEVATQAAMLVDDGKEDKTRHSSGKAEAVAAAEIRAAEEDIQAAHAAVTAAAAQSKAASDGASEALAAEGKIMPLFIQAVAAARSVPYGAGDERICKQLRTLLDQINPHLKAGLDSLELASKTLRQGRHDDSRKLDRLEAARARLSIATSMRDWIRICLDGLVVAASITNQDSLFGEAGAAVVDNAVEVSGADATDAAELLGRLGGEAATLAWPGGERCIYELHRRVEATAHRAVEAAARVKNENRGRVAPGSPAGSLEVETRDGVDDWEAEDDFEEYASESPHEDGDDGKDVQQINLEPRRRHVPAPEMGVEEDHMVYSEEGSDDGD